MKKTVLVVFVLLLFWTNAFTQISSPKLSFGFLHSNFKTNVEAWTQGRAWRMAWWAGIETSPKFITKWMNIDLGLIYQERIPLEMLPYPKGGGLTWVPEQLVFSKFPTNPQNELFHTGNYLRIPNFKYLTIEAIPSVTFGEKLSVSLGLGLFGSLLLNRKQMTITREDLPEVVELFGPPRNVGDAPVLYHRYDAGWIPKVTIKYSLFRNLSIGLQGKSYQSFIRLNDTLISSLGLNQNMRWEAYAMGMSIQYSFGRK